MLDLVLVPSEVSADLQVVRPHEGPMVHWAVLSWVHVSGEGRGGAAQGPSGNGGASTGVAFDTPIIAGVLGSGLDTAVA